jgi:protein FAM32A
MPSDDYTAVTRGSLKLKGGAPAGIKKKKKKPKTSDPSSSTPDPKTSALQKALKDEDAETGKEIVKGKGKGGGAEGEEEMGEEQLRELDPRDGDGKTASERAYEEMRKKRVCSFHFQK